jgi:diguanylate cyclase (GGDEF)-like protein
MIKWPDNKQAQQKRLLHVLRRAHLNIVFTAITVLGLSLTVSGAIALRAYGNESLHLISRAISYNAEAATVFDDHAAALNALLSFGSMTDVASASIKDAQGQILAQWNSPGQGVFVRISRVSAVLLRENPIVTPIVHDGVVIGEVRVTGSGENLVRYILGGFLAIFISQALIIVAAVLLSRRMMDGIIGPLQSFTEVAHAVRQHRDFEHRVPAAKIEELNCFAEDFNALLDELAAWQVHLKKERASLEYKASHDSLTGLPNRAEFEDRLAKAVSEADEKDFHIAVLFLDCDHFKEINDEFGHAVGDAVLVAIAQRLKEQVRVTDLAARLGGDEFALLISPLPKGTEALRVADSIKASMAAPILLPSGANIIASLSAGIAIYPEHATNIEALLQHADLAMYRMKFTSRQSKEIAVRINFDSTERHIEEE